MKHKSGLSVVLFSALSATAINIQAAPIVAQFFGIFTNPGQTWNQKFRADTPFDKLTRVNVAFGKVILGSNNHYTIAFDGDPTNAQAIINRVRKVNPSAEIFLSVGGDGTSTSYGGAAKDPQFAANVLAFLTQYGFNGYDIDWEMSLDQTTLNSLVQNLASVLHARNMKLTLDVWPYIDPAYDMKTLSANLDQINIMSYGTGLSLSSIAQQYINAGFPANKIIGGIESETGYNQFGGVTDTLGANGTIAQKASYARNAKLAGMMEWRLDNDYAPTNNPNYPTYQAAIALWSDMTS